ncbi:hypothetical protein [Oleiphilus sp. HI0086]|uniref:hypothetical protein n=2 Tax=Oleiphilus sp. HI0086 TaxID=1822260 RepID=UPI0012E76D7B|nr:hypothetical protein [Oleiphilus sp. HI0086]
MANRYLEYFQLIVFLWGFEFYSANFDNKRVNEKILALLSPFVLITSINTIHMYITNPNISRTAKKDTAEGLAQMSQGIAGYDFVYFIVFIFAGLMYLSFSFDRKLLVKITLLALAALLFVNIVLSNFMIAMLLSLMVLFCRFFVYKTNKIWLLGYLTLFIIMVPAFSLLFDVLFDALIELNKGSLNEKRLLEIKLILSSGIVEASLGARLHAFELSLQAFANFPLTGIVINSIKNTSGVVTGFGQHSFLLDSFALFGGIVGSVSVYVFLAPVVQMFRERRDINYSSFPFLVCFMVLILFTVNNVTPSVGAAVFFIIPSIFSYMKRKISNELA